MGRGTTGLLLVAVGLLVLFVAITNKWECFVTLFSCLFDIPVVGSPGNESGRVNGASGFVGGAAGGGLVGALGGIDFGGIFGAGGPFDSGGGFGTPPIFGSTPSTFPMSTFGTDSSATRKAR